MRKHERGLVSVLRRLHDELDGAAADAYGWPRPLPAEKILERLVVLNAERAAEERRGLVRWLRPAYQRPTAGIAAGFGDDLRARVERVGELLQTPVSLGQAREVETGRFAVHEQ